jgi:hypothetical protein
LAAGHRGQRRLEPADRGCEWRVPGIRTTPPLLSLCGPSCTATSRLRTPVRSGASGPKGGLERGMEAFLSNFRNRAEPVGKGHSTRATGVQRRKKHEPTISLDMSLGGRPVWRDFRPTAIWTVAFRPLPVSSIGLARFDTRRLTIYPQWRGHVTLRYFSREHDNL